MRGLFKKLLLTLMMIALAQCGGKKSRSVAAATFDVLPEEPIVILGDTKDTEGNDIKGPWFSFRLKMTNTDDSAITLVAITLKITLSGSTTSIPIDFSASEFDHNYKISKDENIECKYSTFESIEANKKEVMLTLDNGIVLSNGVRPCYVVPVFVVGGLELKESGSTYRYQVKARPLGWFGGIDEPTDRFDMTFTFNTK